MFVRNDVRYCWRKMKGLNLATPFQNVRWTGLTAHNFFMDDVILIS